MERVVARAASSLSSAEVTGGEKRKSSTIWPAKNVFHNNMDVWANRSLQQTVKLKETDASTQLS